MNLRPLILTAAAVLSVASARTVSGAEGRFSLTAPDAWKVVSGLPGVDVAFEVPGLPGRANLVTAVAQTLPDGMDLAGYAQATVEALPQMMPNAKIGAPRAVKVDGRAAREVEFTGKRGGRDVYGRVLLVVNGDRGYTVSYMGATPQDAAVKAAIGKTLASFKLAR